jgi:tRNA threonylcarbamoyl adenosine modification protein YeaZ
MAILLLDTASSKHLLALLNEEKTSVFKSLPLLGDTGLISTLEEALKEAGWEYRDLTHIACVIGPGGFASIRTGITAANTLAYALGIPLAGVHLSELWKWRIFGKLPANYWIHSTKKNLLFVRGFGEYEKKFSEAALISLDDAKNLEGEYVGELIEEHIVALPGLTPLSEKEISPLTEVLPSFLKSLSYGKTPLVPWYGREP